MARSHRRGVYHRIAHALVAWLRDEGGSTMLTNHEVASVLGVKTWQYDAGRRHIFACPELNAAVAYRRPGGALTLFESNGTAILQSLADRTYPALAGHRNQRHNAEVVRVRSAAIIETSAKEALSRGETALATALDSAANDVRTTGDLHPMTVAQLRALGAIA